jgi:hypothetical protein
MDTRRIERYAAEVYRRLENADPREDTHAMVAHKYTSPESGPWMQSGLERIDIDFGDLHARICTEFIETLQNPEVRGSTFDASEALFEAGLKSNGLTCSRGMVKVRSFLYEFHTVNLNYGWTLRFVCECVGGRVSKTIYEKPTIQAIAVRIPNVFEAHFVGHIASLLFVRPTLVDIRPIVREVRICAETYGCTTFETNIPLEWVRNLWLS